MSKSKSISIEVGQIFSLQVAPGNIIKGENSLSNSGDAIASFGQMPLVVGGEKTIKLIETYLEPICKKFNLKPRYASYLPDCSETSLKRLEKAVKTHEADFIIGVGGKIP